MGVFGRAHSGGKRLERLAPTLRTSAQHGAHVTAIIDWLTAQVAGNPLLVAVVVAVFAACESLVVVGTVVPGTTVVLALAAAGGATGHGLGPMMVAATLGAVAGDGVSYWIGRRYGTRIAGWGPLARRPQLFEAARSHFRQGGAASVALARFVPGIRAIVPAVAGMLHMPPARFYTANAASAVVWAGLHVYGAGLTANLLARLGGRLATVVIGALVVIALAGWLFRLALGLVLPRVQDVRVALYRAASRRRDPLSRALAWTVAPNDPTGILVVLAAAVIVGALVLIGAIAQGVLDGDQVVMADLAIAQLIQTWRSPALDRAMVIVTMLGDPIVLAALALGTIAWLAHRRLARVATAFAAAVAVTAGFVPLAQALLTLAPAGSGLPAAASAVLPAAQTANAAVLFGLLAALLLLPLRGAWHFAVAVVLVAIALAIAFSRVYLQVHWPTEVVTALLFAAAISAAFLIAIGARSPHQIAQRGLAAVTALALAGVGGIHVATGYATAAAAHAPRDLSVALAPAQWRRSPWRDVPAGRIDFEGEVETPFLFQWRGDLGRLAPILAAAEWTRAPAWRLEALRRFVSPSAAIADLPPVLELHLGRPPDAVWTKALGPTTRLVLRVWPSRYRVDGTPLRFGAVEVETVERPLGLFTLIDDRPAPPEAVADLAARLAAAADGDGRALSAQAVLHPRQVPAPGAPRPPVTQAVD